MTMTENIVIAGIGFIGVVVGAICTSVAEIVKISFLQRSAKKAEKARKELLRSMLNHPDYPWRSFTRLKHVIGADDDTTRTLLLHLGARASEDGDDMWGLISRNPFENEK